jgi:hypothetical protein
MVRANADGCTDQDELRLVTYLGATWEMANRAAKA